MRALPLLALCVPLGGCGGADMSGNQVQNRVVTAAPAPAPVDCLQGLPPGPPEAAADAAAGRGDHRVYRYGQNGFAFQYYVAGYESCSGPGVDVPRSKDGARDDRLRQEDSLDLGEIRDRSQPVPADGEAPLSQCGRARMDYAARYNRELFRRGGRGPAPSCQPPTE